MKISKKLKIFVFSVVYILVKFTPLFTSPQESVNMMLHCMWTGYQVPSLRVLS
jgi:hypothetical protein